MSHSLRNARLGELTAGLDEARPNWRSGSLSFANDATLQVGKHSDGVESDDVSVAYQTSHPPAGSGAFLYIVKGGLTP
jgi:hypothetical protein